jgi:hypothetical protein
MVLFTGVKQLSVVSRQLLVEAKASAGIEVSERGFSE